MCNDKKNKVNIIHYIFLEAGGGFVDLDLVLKNLVWNRREFKPAHSFVQNILVSVGTLWFIQLQPHL